MCKGFFGFGNSWPPEMYESELFFYISDAKSLLVQPALCAHTVLTLSKGAAMVTGWEASNPHDERRIREVTNCFGF